MTFTLTPSANIRRAYNGYLAVVHLALAVGSIFIDIEPITLETPIPGYRDDCLGDRFFCTVSRSSLLFDYVDVGLLACAFSGVTAMAHLFYYTNYEAYQRLVDTRQVWRWRALEYALSVPPMLITMCSLTGTLYDISLLQIGTLGATTQFFGYVADVLASMDNALPAIYTHLLGYPVILAALAPMFISISQLQYTDAPSFVPLIIVTQIAFFMSFGFVQGYVLKRLQKDIVDGTQALTYARADTIYLFLSLACKATLIGSLVYTASRMDEFIEGSAAR